MNLLLLAYLGTVTAAVLVGASLSGIMASRRRYARYTVAFSAGVMLAVCLLYLIPDALQFQHGITQPSAVSESGDHVSIGYALSLGFLSLLTVERYLLRAHHHHHGHDHGAAHAHDRAQRHDCERDHAPPHHHQHNSLAPSQPDQPDRSDRQDLGVAWSTGVALALHGLFDGVALYAAGVMPAMGPALAVAIILHKVPEAATLLTVLRRAGTPRRQRQMALWSYVAATPLGMLAAARLLVLLSERRVALLMAFVAGSLLHLTTGHLLPEATQHDEEGEGRSSSSRAYGVMLLGFCSLVVARLLGAD